MVQTGKVCENLMINLKPVNIKLTGRMISIVMDLTDYNEDEARKALEEHDWNIRSVVDAYKSGEVGNNGSN